MYLHLPDSRPLRVWLITGGRACAPGNRSDIIVSPEPSDDLFFAGPVTPRDPDLALDEDLYCLTCGYNLRGLYGDPVRCPECGELNDLGTAAIPAEFIRRGLREMETAPTYCTAFALMIAACLAFVLLTNWPQSACPGAALVGLLVAWSTGYREMKSRYHDRPGWRRILVDFHVATLLCTIAIPAVISVCLIKDYPLYAVPGPVWIGAGVIGVPCFVGGLRIYYASRKRIAVMQRDAAVRIARETLRRALHQFKRRL